MFAIPSFLIKLSGGTSDWIIPLSAANIFFSLIGYWFFSAELLRTALLLPSLFTDAKQGWMLNEIHKHDKAASYSTTVKEDQRGRKGKDIPEYHESLIAEGPY